MILGHVAGMPVEETVPAVVSLVALLAAWAGVRFGDARRRR